MTKVPIVILRPSVRYITQHPTKGISYCRRLALLCLGKAYCSHLLHITAMLFGSLAWVLKTQAASELLSFHNYIEQEEVPRYYGKKET